ncbi:MAG: cupin domain-containing protein [Mariprofundaceae bacterium]|nr:cupin domain-containing protein [Mariprofundaceae bacterium]
MVVEKQGYKALIETGYYGNIWIVKQYYPKKDVIHEGHRHPHDHISIVIRGRVLVKVDGRESIFTAPTFFGVDKDKHHTIIALEDDTAILCVHANEGKPILDPDGKPLTQHMEPDNMP